MRIIYSDELNRLTPEMKALMQKAADAALETEFGSEIEAADAAFGVNAEVGVTVVNDEEIRELNRGYRGNDKVTDVLSFPQYEGREELLADLIDSAGRAFGDFAAVTLIGDVVICCEQAERQAEEYGTGLKREMLYLFVHSIMHLFGYDHMEPEEKAAMRAREEEVLSLVGLSRDD